MPNIDISFLENLRNLNYISISDCGIISIDCLKDLNPEKVYLWDNNIESLPDLSNWTKIKKLDLSGNPITKNRDIVDENGDVYMSYFKNKSLADFTAPVCSGIFKTSLQYCLKTSTHWQP